MDCDAVLVAHLVEFVDAYDTAVGEDHCTAFKVEFAGLGVALNRGGETSSGGTFAGGIDGDWGNFFDEFKELGFSGTGVSEEEDVDVTTELHAVGKNLFRAAKEEECDGFLNVFVTVDRGADGAGQFFIEIRVARHLKEFLFFSFGEHGIALSGVVSRGLDTDKADVGVADCDGGPRALGTFGLVD